MNKEISVSNEAKHYLAVELGNQGRFLYEYGYSQIVDILAKGGFLRSPEPVIVDLEVGAKAMHAKTKYGKLGFPKHDAGMAWINKAKACAEAWGLKWK